MKKKLFPLILSLLLPIFLTSCPEEVHEPDNPNQSNTNTETKPTADGEIVTSGAVDLGLSVKWAACNLGATECYENGTSYKWGDQRTNCELDICGTEYDQATTELGPDWQLPSKAEMEELINKCRWSATTYRGVSGFVVTGPSGNAIFLPRTSDSYYTWYCELWTGMCDVKSNNAFAIYVEYYESYSDIYSRFEDLMISTYSRSSYLHIRPVYVGY